MCPGTLLLGLVAPLGLSRVLSRPTATIAAKLAQEGGPVVPWRAISVPKRGLGITPDPQFCATFGTDWRA